MLVSRANAYTFEVVPTASKTQIAAAVEEVFAVKVVDVNTVMRGRHLRRTGRRRILTLVPRKKKAVITLAKGNTIGLFDMTGAPEAAPANSEAVTPAKASKQKKDSKK